LTDTDGHPLAQFAAPDEQWRLTLTESEISPHLLAAIVAAEDARFYDHHGVDWKSAFTALWQDAASLHSKRGATTITIQLHRRRRSFPPVIRRRSPTACGSSRSMPSDVTRVSNSSRCGPAISPPHPVPPRTSVPGPRTGRPYTPPPTSASNRRRPRTPRRSRRT